MIITFKAFLDRTCFQKFTYLYIHYLSFSKRPQGLCGCSYMYRLRHKWNFVTLNALVDKSIISNAFPTFWKIFESTSDRDYLFHPARERLLFMDFPMSHWRIFGNNYEKNWINSSQHVYFVSHNIKISGNTCVCAWDQRAQHSTWVSFQSLNVCIISPRIHFHISKSILRGI